MRSPLRSVAFAALAFALLAPPATAERRLRVAIPDPPARFVYDVAGALDAASARALESKLIDLDRRGIEIGVAIVPTLEGEPIEDVSIAIAERWRPGSADEDDGALIVVATADRAIRIEVGYGLEGRVTDAAAGRIIRNLMAPEFRRGRYGPGLIAAVDALATLAAGGELPPAAKRSRGDDSLWIPILFVVLWLVMLWLRRHHPSIWIAGSGWGHGGGRRGGGSFGGGSFGGGSFGGGGASGGW